jgi:TATA-box binding protein (TBP) (component of TFIID and TFIIIB)
MNRGIREFVESSGIRVETASPPSREVKLNLLKRQEVPNTLQRNIINDRRYAGMFREFENENNEPLGNEFNALFNNILAPPVKLEMSKLNLDMFNANVNSVFGKEPRINMKNILSKKPLDKTFIGEGLYLDTLDIKGIYGRFQTGFSHSKEYGPKGNINKDYFSVQIVLRISNETESHKVTFNIYKNGKIRFSGGFVGTNIAIQPELIRRFVVGRYTDKEPFLYNPFEYNNISGKFRFNGVFKNLGLVAARYREYGMTNVSYEPELGPFFYAYVGDHKYNITKSGNVQILGGKSPEDVLDAYNRGQQLIEKMNDGGEITITGVFSKSETKTKAKPKVKVVANAKPKGVNVTNKACERMPKPELVDLARRLGVVGKFKTRKEICQKIRNLNNKKTVTVKNTRKGKNVAITGKIETDNFRIGRKRCDQHSKPELEMICKAMNIPFDKKDTKLILCKKIESARNIISTKSPSPSPKAKAKAKKSNAKSIAMEINRQLKINNVEMKRRLDENSIRNDLAKYFGVVWMNRYKPNLSNDVKIVQNEINKLNLKRNSLGIPFKRDINAIKKKLVNRWKMERKLDLEKKYLMRNMNVTGVNYQLNNEYRRAAANFIMSRKKPPSKLAMNEYRKYWLKFKANGNGNFRRATARVEKL